MKEHNNNTEKPDEQALKSDSPFGQSGANRRFHSILEEIVDAEMERKHGKDKNEGKIQVKMRDLFKILVVLLLGFSWLRVYIDQIYIRDKKGSEEAGNLAKEGARALAKHKKANLTRAHTGNSKNDIKALAAKILVTAPTHPMGWQPDRTWMNLVKCAANSVWGGYRSKTHLRLSENMLTSYRANRLHIFTPYYAGSQQIYSGIFWQKPMVKLARIFPIDLNAWFERKYFALPLVYHAGIGRFLSHAYIDVRRDGLISEAAPSSLGEANMSLDDLRQFIPLHASAMMWEGTSQSQIEANSRLLLQRELEMQILRYQKAKGARRFTYIRNPLDALVFETVIHNACLAAGQGVRSPIIERAAANHLAQLQNRGAELARPGFAVRNTKTSAGYPYQFVEVHGLINRQQFEHCAEDFHITRGLRMPVSFTIQSSGEIANPSIYMPSGLSSDFTSCVKNRMLSWKFPQPERAVPQQVKFELIYN